MNALAPATKRKNMNSPMSVLPAMNAPETMFKMYDCTISKVIEYLDPRLTYDCDAPFPALAICDHRQEQRSERATRKKEAIHCSNKSIRIRSSSKMEVFTKGGLAWRFSASHLGLSISHTKSSRDDCCGISIANRTWRQCQKD